MQIVAINAKWVPSERVMMVTLSMAGQYFEDKLDRAAWDNYISHIDDEPFRVCGQQIIIQFTDGEDSPEFEPPEDSIVIDKLKGYLRAVDRAMRVRGNTNMLPEF